MDLIVILHELQGGDRTHFPELYEATKRPVFYNILAITKDHGLAEDILQETFIRFLQNPPNTNNENKLLGYLMRVSKNLALDLMEKRSRMDEIPEGTDLPSVDVHRIDEEILVGQIKKILNEKEFQVFILHVLGNQTFEEIHKTLKRPLGTILWSYNEAIKKLRKEMRL
ncbi:MAG: sigma-70 family RNA polymerase sigma factor [Candidatus Enteromonas sp.]|nr:sigma-70 family RNA polymerase sigma factor [Candidatus Enteromonas sp.]